MALQVTGPWRRRADVSRPDGRVPGFKHDGKQHRELNRLVGPIRVGIESAVRALGRLESDGPASIAPFVAQVIDCCVLNSLAVPFRKPPDYLSAERSKGRAPTDQCPARQGRFIVSAQSHRVAEQPFTDPGLVDFDEPGTIKEAWLFPGDAAQRRFSQMVGDLRLDGVREISRPKRQGERAKVEVLAIILGGRRVAIDTPGERLGSRQVIGRLGGKQGAARFPQLPNPVGNTWHAERQL